MRALKYAGIVLLVLFLLMLLPWYQWLARPAPDFGASDPAVVSAIQSARGRWQEFLSLFNAQRPRAMGAVLVPFHATAGGQEPIWIVVESADGTVVHGRIYEAPRYEIGHSEGELVAVMATEIIDWEYIDYSDPGSLKGPFVEPLLMNHSHAKKSP